MEYVGKVKKVKGWKGMEERRKASQDGICIERKREMAWKEMDEKKTEWMGWIERRKSKGMQGDEWKRREGV